MGRAWLRNPYNKNENNLNPILDCWNRIYKGLEQCENTAKSKLITDREKEIFKLIVVNKTVVGEAASFFALRHKSAFKKLGLKWGKFNILSDTQFKYLVSSGCLDKFAKECTQIAEPLHEQDFIEIKPKIRIKALNILFEPYKNFWENNYYKLDKMEQYDHQEKKTY